MAYPTRLRLLLILVPAALVLIAAIALGYRKAAPPLAARLLPECDAVVYFDLAPARSLTGFGSHPVPHAPDYQAFIDATGIDPERDLDEAAFALQRTAQPFGPNGPVAYSEIFAGRFDRDRLARYLRGIAQGQELYAGQTVYSVPSQGRTVRIALLGGGRVAVSNTASPEQMHAILDRARSAAWLPWVSPEVLHGLYHQVPLLSLAWGVGQLALPFTEGPHVSFFGLQTPWRTDSTFVASLRWSGALQLRLDQIAANDAAAASSAASLADLLRLARLADDAIPAHDAALRAAIDGAEVGHQGNHAILTASLPVRALQQLLARTPAAPSGPQLR